MNNAFDRVILNSMERPLSSDLNQHFSQVDMMIKEIMRGFFLAHSQYANEAGVSSFTPRSGFLGDGFFVTANGSANIFVQPGLGFIFGALGSATPIDAIAGLLDLANFYPVYMPAALTIPIPAPGAGNERYDIIEVKLDVRRQDSASRDVFDPVAGVFSSSSLLKTLSYVLDSTRYGTVTSPSSSTAGISLKKGTAATVGSALPPATTAGYTRIAIIYSSGASPTINQSNIQDRRRLLWPENATSLAFKVSQVPGAPDAVAFYDYPVAPAGVRLAARSLAPSGGQMRFYIFAGEAATVADDPPTWTLGAAQIYAFPIGQIKCNPPSAVSLANLSDATIAKITTGEKAALAGIINVDVGQPYLTFTGIRYSISGSASSWIWEICCPMRYV
jgi:hypothetical protein